ncbi:hypothetical protein OCD65_27995 [Bacillus paranthracis]|uniref:hypothetical protein n=1 Tax=Bacillus cereus group TaxID=86661 RepID=UPI001F58ACC5|nr:MULTISPECIES: hypothetical protein [Bacillus cereus group]MCU5020524.1 hypothetical protein [Bacillus paranthracis]
MENLLLASDVANENDFLATELYTKEKIDSILKEYHYFLEVDLKDGQLVQVKADIDRALESNVLEAEHRKVLACEYALELNIMQGAKMSGLKVKEYREALDEALESLEAVLNGYKSEKLPTRVSQATDYTEYIQEVAEGVVSIFDMNASVINSLLHFLAKRGDALSKYKLGHAVTEDRETPRAFVDLEEEDSDPYPFYKTSSAIEDPMRKADYVDWRVSGEDYFRKQDKNRGVVSYGDLTIIDYQDKVDGNRKIKTSNGEEKC